ncbi:Transposase family tnp2 [Rhizoctonia solani]|uniref:Transposase family tnp2 n=1 Tax=Rhizoctonia solani TaxID=456999 RepID=A0A8H8NY45_9AGAM|nr:Transposase family tnp2 [Rhizoctonia solani]QRW22084.1 Transposase family tnp2 [Rhizoctonia solani]
MDAGDRGPLAKRQRRSHHKERPLELCYCARCKGQVKQKVATINDHRLRYPHPIKNLPAQPLGVDETVIVPQYLEPVRSGIIPDEQGLDQQSFRGSLEPQSPTPSGAGQARDCASPNPPLLPRILDNYRPPVPLGDPERLNDPEEGIEPGLLAAAEELERVYDFNELIDNSGNLDNNHPDYLFENALDDTDFGLPDVQEQDTGVLPRFDFAGSIEPEDPEEPEEPGCGLDDIDEPNNFCAAFREPALIRNAYIDAFVQKTLYRATHQALTHQLKASRRTISSHPDITIDHINGMAQTITTVERRLGVNTGEIITTFTLCPVCKRRYSPEYIKETDDHHCLNDECDGVLFVYHRLASGVCRKVSKLTYPYASPIPWLRHIFSLPGMSELMQTWRSGDDDHGIKPPVSNEDWMRNLNHNKELGNITEGWGWRSTMAGLQQVQDPDTRNVIDESGPDPPIRFVSLPYGISFSLNTDWFHATKEGSYSVGACYLVINNLPRHMRFLRENISLSIVMPGPNEPNEYALDQMLDPLIDDILRLKQGVRMLVRRGDPPVYEEEVVYGELTQHIADLIARIKMGEGAGVKSEANFCLYCRSHLSNLSVLEGYMRQGGMNWIVKQILVGPGMIVRREFGGPEPQDIFNDCLDHMWMPKNFQQLPPKLGQTRTSTKANQWKLTARVIFIPLYLAFRDGDTIQPILVPRGNRNSPGAKHQAYRAKLLHQQRQKYYASIGQANRCPRLEECFPSRNLQFHYRQVLRFCLATSILDKRNITPANILFATGLLETMCKDYITHNIPLSPNFHYMMHLEEFLLKTGSVYNTHVWAMEHANGVLSRINHNGKGGGVLEGTLMRGWWRHMTLQNLIKSLQALPNRTPDDTSVLNDLLTALRGGNKHAQQRGTLMAFIAQCQTEYTQQHGIEKPIRLSSQSRLINLEKAGLYKTVFEFCTAKWPNAGIFGPNVIGVHYLAPHGMVRNHSYVEFNGIRYGSHEHTSGKGYCYAYIDNRQAVRIERILAIEIPGTRFRGICVLVRLFQAPEVEPDFPWAAWSENLGVNSWVFGALGETITIDVAQLSGTFALFIVPTSGLRYWVSVELDSIGLGYRLDNEDEDV